jgi:hypothetical protein
LARSTYFLRKLNPTWALFLVNLTTSAKICQLKWNSKFAKYKT